MTGYESIPDFVDWTQPINWGDPLNFGLVEKYIAVEGGGYGGGKWLGLARGNHGTLTNMTTGYGWQGPKGRIGGWGAMRFDGSDDYVNCGASFPQLTGTHSVFAWVYYASNPALGVIVGRYNNSSGIAQVLFSNIAGSLTCTLYNNLSGFIQRYAVASTLNTWKFVGYTYSGGSTVAAITLYLNGLSVTGTTGSGGSFTSPASAAIPLCIGSSSVPSFYFPGYIDDVSVYNRALSAGEVAGLYEASMSHYPTQLNRFAYRRRYVTAGGFNPAWAARSTITLQPGICA